MNKDKILIVDDTLDNMLVLYDFLTSFGFNVLTAEDGEEGIQVVEYTQPDLILLDILMPPNMNGFEVCKHLKSQDKTKDIPIIFMTALTDVVDKINGFELGAADYITKPFQQEEVLARINAHLTIRRQNKQLQEHQKEIEAFARTVAHDLKNPVGNMTTMTELFLELYPLNTTIDAKGTKIIQLSHGAGQQALNIINALLTLCGISQQNSIRIKPLSMDKIIKPIIQEYLAPMIEEQQAQIDLPASWPAAFGYAPWVEEIWTNYISNGLKYGGKPPKLIFGSDQQDDMVRFWIRDNGKGISQEEISKLFTPFTRLNHEPVEGHGLGLSIVQQIMEKLNGQAGVESELEQGSTFYFTLPVYKVIQ